MEERLDSSETGTGYLSGKGGLYSKSKHFGFFPLRGRESLAFLPFLSAVDIWKLPIPEPMTQIRVHFL